MCQFQSLRQPAEPIPAPPLEGARALYPLLDTNETLPPALLPPGSSPSTGIEIALEPLKTGTPTGPTQARVAGVGEVPSPAAAPGSVEQRPKVVEANAGRVLVEIAERAGALLRRQEPAPLHDDVPGNLVLTIKIHRLFKDTFFGKINRATFTEIWVP